MSQKTKNIKAFFLLVPLLFCFLPARAQNFEWVKRMGGSGVDEGRAIARDAEGNLYVTGSFQQSADFGIDTITAQDLKDVFLAKFNKGGNTVWVRSAGGRMTDEGNAIALDGQGNIYIAGSFMDSAVFGNIRLKGSGWSDAFIAKYNPAGQVLWVRKAGGKKPDFGNSLAVDKAGNCFLTGTFEQTVSIGSTTLTSAGSADIFVAKFDSSGNPLWAQRAGGLAEDGASGITADTLGNCYITGYFRGIAVVGEHRLGSKGESDILLAKFDASGNALWARSAGGQEQDQARSIALCGGNHIRITGFFKGQASFGPIAMPGTPGGCNIFIARYDDAGNPVWASHSECKSGTVSGMAIATDGSGNCYVTGTFSGSANIGSKALNSGGLNDIFVLKYDPYGELQWTKQAGGRFLDTGLGIAADKKGSCYITGSFQTAAGFGDHNMTRKGEGIEIFIAKMKAW